MNVTNSIDVVPYLKSIISTTFNVIVDRMIVVSGHGKYLVEGINACDKCYFMEKMFMIDTLEVDRR